jgi:hypothetical protein
MVKIIITMMMRMTPVLVLLPSVGGCPRDAAAADHDDGAQAHPEVPTP